MKFPGELMPLRAFGDIRFKWPSKELKHVARLLDLPPNYPIMPSFYETPPYLCSIPQVTWRPLIKNRDHFLVLATDGLWDMLSPKEAINVVAQHWFDYTGVSLCQFEHSLILPLYINLSYMTVWLIFIHQDPSACGPGDTAASRLIRTALGGDEMDPERISAHFSMPATVARYYRDDITVVVVYLPSSASLKPSWWWPFLPPVHNVSFCSTGCWVSTDAVSTRDTFVVGIDNVMWFLGTIGYCPCTE